MAACGASQSPRSLPHPPLDVAIHANARNTSADRSVCAIQSATDPAA
jgi:hypothetical protein